MNFEIELFNKDSVKLNMLKSILDKKAAMTFQLNNGASVDYLAKIRKEGSRVQVYENFNISEDPSGEIITIRPIMVNSKLSVTITSRAFGNTICVYRSATKSVEKEIPFDSDCISLVFVPQDEKYRLQFKDYNQPDAELERIEGEISVIERKKDELARKKKNALNHLEKIETEYKKDYANLEQELDEIKSRLGVDESIIQYYKDRDIVPVETIFQEIKLKLEDAEKQIRCFIEARQRKTMEIEG